MTRRNVFLLAALLLAAGLAIFGDRGGDSDLALPLARRAPVAGSGAERPATTAPTTAPTTATTMTTTMTTLSGAALAAAPIGSLRARASYIGSARVRPGGTPAFGAQSWAPPPPAPVAAVAPPPPVAPPLPFTYVGRQVVDGQTDIFLAEGERLFIARAKTAIDAKYRIESIAAGSVTFIYLPLNQAQQLSIGAPD